MSNLRSFLRLAVSRFMARVRPRDYGSLTGGMVDDALSCIASQAHLCSQNLLVVACLAEDGICPRCKEASENLMHRWWYCQANKQYRLQLNSLVPAAVSLPDSLPRTLAPDSWPRTPAGKLGRALPGRAQVSLESGCLKPHLLPLTVCKLRNP